MAQHPQLAIQRAQTANFEGARRVAAGDFDLTLTSSIFQTHSGNPQTTLLSEELFGTLTPQSLVGDTTSYQLQATKLFRDGISITPTAGVSRTTDNATQKVGVNFSQANFQITFPLLRGRGQEVVTARERGAGMDYDAALLDMNQTVANVVLNVAQDYWGLVAAKKRLQVALDSEARGRSLVAMTQALIDASQLPRIEMDNAAANLADRVSQRVAADAALVAAREQLALSAGIPGAEVARGLDATDEFPVSTEVEAPPEGSHVVGEWLENARRYRADMLASTKRLQSATTRRIAALDQIRPSLGLVGTVGYNGLRQGRTLWQYLGSPFPAAAGLNASVGLQYTFAPANDAAKGQLEMASAAISGAKAQLDDLERSVRSSIVVAVENLRSSVLRLRTTRETVDSYQLALDGEREKLKLGVSLSDRRGSCRGPLDHRTAGASGCRGHLLAGNCTYAFRNRSAGSSDRPDPKLQRESVAHRTRQHASQR